MPLFLATPRPLDDDQVVRVRDPATGQLVPPQGVIVDWSDYWERRLQDGDVSKSSPPIEEPEALVYTPSKDARPRRAHHTTPASSAEKED